MYTWIPQHEQLQSHHLISSFAWLSPYIWSSVKVGSFCQTCLGHPSSHFLSTLLLYPKLTLHLLLVRPWIMSGPLVVGNMVFYKHLYLKWFCLHCCHGWVISIHRNKRIEKIHCAISFIVNVVIFPCQELTSRWFPCPGRSRKPVYLARFSRVWNNVWTTVA